MDIKHLVIACIAVAATALSGSVALAAGIYKWTDDDGNVHYEDRPSGDSSEEIMQLTFKRTNSNSVQNRVAAGQDAESKRREARAAEAEEAKTAAEKRADAEKRQQQCDTQRARLENLVQSRRLYREDENGERTYLDEEQRQEARAQAEKSVQDLCN